MSKFLFWCVFAFFVCSSLATGPFEECVHTGAYKNKERREISVSQLPYVGFMWYRTQIEYHQYENGRKNHDAVTIIDKNMVLTTGRICETSLSSSMDISVGQTYVHPHLNQYSIKKYVNHQVRRDKYKLKTFDESQTLKNYDYNIRAFNFCVMLVNGEFVWSPFVQKAPLPYPREKVRGDTRFFVAGWGPIEDNTYQAGNCIRRVADGPHLYVYAPLFYHYTTKYSDEGCKDFLCGKASGKNYYGERHEDVYCFEYRCKSYHTTYGDEGAPMVDMLTNKVIGIVTNIRQWDGWERPQLGNMMCFAVDFINEYRMEWTGVGISKDEEEIVLHPRG